jgi:hypothetical protein
MKYLPVTLALLTFICGLIAARYWYCAIRIKIIPNWENFMEGVVGKEQQIYTEDLSNDLNMTAWKNGNMVAFTKSAKMNACAAVWTAITVALTAISSILPII